MLKPRSREIRDSKGLKQMEVAKAANITVRSYQYYESGDREPPVTVAFRIADVLKVDVRELFS